MRESRAIEIFVDMENRSYSHSRLGFSDTVNTASRMESTGSPRTIQLSQATADALIMSGKQSWLVPRKQKVFAKGKGEVQTYVLEIRGKTERTRSISHHSVEG